MVAEVIGGKNGGGDLPSSVGLLELNEPLIGCDAVAGLGIVVEDMDGLSHLHWQFHDFVFLQFLILGRWMERNFNFGKKLEKRERGKKEEATPGSDTSFAKHPGFDRTATRCLAPQGLTNNGSTLE
ncbi:uncharacterized protein G2W53_041127 [Senna tora]|uniref:Uncharacterized protein n=1 Tax=Senna tora TaxID=362788 RepID=A0A834SF82_9FABA|nr:uncharacterized protein G2W53_041127 [Senna tora]